MWRAAMAAMCGSKPRPMAACAPACTSPAEAVAEAKLLALGESADETTQPLGFITDDENADAQTDPPCAAACPQGGRRIVNSVNAPGSLSTVIVPPCCCVTMS